MLLFLLLCRGLNAGEVKVYPAPNTDFSLYKTYHWLPPRLFTKYGVTENDERVAPLIRNAVNRELSKKGLSEVPKGGDLEIISAGVANGTQQLEGFLVTYGFDVFWGYGVVSAQPISRYNKEGTLAVGLVDTHTKKGIWVGMATEALGRPEKVGSAVDKAAERMFKKYPPKK